MKLTYFRVFAPPATSIFKYQAKEKKRKWKKRNTKGEKSPPKLQPVTSITTRNFFSLLNSGDMETEDSMGDEGRKETPKGTGQPPPIIVTTNTHLIKDQKEIKTKLKGDFTLCNTRNGFQITTKTRKIANT